MVIGVKAHLHRLRPEDALARTTEQKSEGSQKFAASACVANSQHYLSINRRQ
jgi:hypothetical protein